MWQVFGICGQHSPKIIATFDTKKDADGYLKAAKLKYPTQDRIFKKKSLLCGYDRAWTQERRHTEPIPHNPLINF